MQMELTDDYGNTVSVSGAACVASVRYALTGVDCGVWCTDDDLRYWGLI